MHNYRFQQAELSADLLPILREFSSGVEAMDDILHSKLLLAELHTDEPQAFFVKTEEDANAAFFIIGKIYIPFGDKDHEEYYEMIDVACLAVAEEYRNQGLGTAILDYICEKADKIIPECDFIHVDALDLDDGSYSAVPFYKKYGFVLHSRSGVDAARMFYSIQ